MSKLRRYLLGLVAGLAITITGQAACPTGTTVWSVNANGFTGTMTLSNNSGILTGTFLGSPIKGFCSDSAGRLMFYRAINGTTSSTPPEQIQVYTADTFPASVFNPLGPQRLAGSFEAFSGTGARK
jgi:hypothetical protein